MTRPTEDDLDVMRNPRPFRRGGAGAPGSTDEEDAEQAALARAAGVSEPAVLRALRAEGLRADLLGLLWLAPAIAMAWADGVVTRRERRLIDRLTESDQVRATGRLGARLLNRWTTSRPSDAFFRAATRALASTVSALPEPERSRACNRLVSELTTVAVSSGGVLGIGSLSIEEQQWLREVEAELGAARDRGAAARQGHDGGMR